MERQAADVEPQCTARRKPLRRNRLTPIFGARLPLPRVLVGGLGMGYTASSHTRFADLPRQVGVWFAETGARPFVEWQSAGLLGAHGQSSAEGQARPGWPLMDVGFTRPRESRGGFDAVTAGRWTTARPAFHVPPWNCRAVYDTAGCRRPPAARDALKTAVGALAVWFHAWRRPRKFRTVASSITGFVARAGTRVRARLQPRGGTHLTIPFSA
jgi:hypothetical protein